MSDRHSFAVFELRELIFLHLLGLQLFLLPLFDLVRSVDALPEEPLDIARRLAVWKSIL